MQVSAMEKVALNNKIVSMRGEVERAKVHCTHKLTRKVKSLETQKSWHTQVQRQKIHLKARRLTTEILLMKKLNKDDVSKFALINTKKTLDALRADPEVPADEKVMARLASHPKLIETVEKFQSQFPTWAAIFPSIIENLGVKVTKVRKSVRLEVIKREIKKQIEDQRIDEEILSEGSISDSDLNTNYHVKKNSKTILKADLKSPPKVKAVVGKWKVEETEDDDTGDADVASIDMERKHGSHIGSINQSTDIEKADATFIDIKRKHSSISKNKNASKETESETESETTPEVPVLEKSKEKSTAKVTAPRSKFTKVIRFSDLINEVHHEESTRMISIDEPLLTPATKAVDSFFVSEDGQSEFMSMVKVDEPSETDDIETDANKYDKLRQQYLKDYGRLPNRKELRSSERQQGGSSFESFQSKQQNRPSNDRGYYKVPHNNDQGFGNNKNTKIAEPASKWPGEKLSSKNRMPKASVPEGPVHPSWEAKKKQKEMLNISSFQGKKIKFDD